MRFSQRAAWLYGRGGFSQGDSTTGSSEVQAPNGGDDEKSVSANGGDA